MTVDSSKYITAGKDVGKLKRIHKISKLIQLVDKATRNFVAVGEQIANENPEFQVRFSDYDKQNYPIYKVCIMACYTHNCSCEPPILTQSLTPMHCKLR